MKFILPFCCMLLLMVAKAQVWAGFSSPWMPDSITRSSSAIAAYIQTRYNSKDQQLRAAYSWVTANIRYSDDSSYYFNWSVDEATKVAATLRRKKGVCENFAAVFSDIAKHLDLTSFVVHGYSSIASNSRNVAHSWSAVKLDSEWHLFDPTWDAGIISSFQYYMLSPDVFVQTHIPFDPIWQLLEKPVGYKVGNDKNKTRFNYKDSISAFLTADSLQQYMGMARRMKNTDINKELMSTWQSYNRMNITIIGQEQNMLFYNAAVDDLNKATDLFNAFVTYRNNRFLPSRNDAAVEAMLKPISLLITDARKKLDNIGLIAENFQYDTESLKKRLDTIYRRTEEQKVFLRRYLTATLSEKEKLLYSR